MICLLVSLCKDKSVMLGGCSLSHVLKPIEDLIAELIMCVSLCWLKPRLCFCEEEGCEEVS